MAAAPFCTISTPPAARPAFTSAASFFTTGTICFAPDGASSAFRPDSFSCVVSAALAGPLGPSHHQRYAVEQHWPSACAHLLHRPSCFASQGAVALATV